MTRHPKILRAGSILNGANGGGGAGRAFALFVDALSYARAQLTNGFVPTDFVMSSPLVTDPETVADALTKARLWHRVPRGFRIHDFHDWNPSAETVRAKRAQAAAKKRRQRSEQNPIPRTRLWQESRGVSPGDDRGTTRARGTMIHDPLRVRTSGSPPRSIRTESLYGQCTNRRLRVGLFTKAKKTNADRSHLAAAMRDCERRDPARADDRRRRVGGTDQAADRPSASELSAAVRDHVRDARRRARARERTGTAPAAAAATLAAGAASTLGAAVPALERALGGAAGGRLHAAVGDRDGDRVASPRAA